MRISVLTTLKENWNVKVIVDPTSKEKYCDDRTLPIHLPPNYLIVILEIASISLLYGAIFSFLIFSLCNFWILFLESDKKKIS